MSYAVTFDFHNTLASCDSWFELEVRGLVPAYLRWEATQTGRAVAEETLDAAAGAYRDLRREIAEHGRELTAERCIAEVLDRLGLASAPDEIARGVETLMRATENDLEPISGAVELVAALRANDVILGVVSSAVYHPFLERSLTSIGIFDAFASVVTSASAGYYKSRTEIYTQTLTHLGVEPARSLHIGDSLRWDVTTAKRAGMKTVWLNPGRLHAESAPDLDVETLVEAAPAILELLYADAAVAP